MICLILKPFVKVLRACPSSILKDLVFTISKTNFITYNTPLYNIPYIKTSIFLTRHLNIISLLIFYSFSLYLSFLCVSLSQSSATRSTHTTTTTFNHLYHNHHIHPPSPPPTKSTATTNNSREKRNKKKTFTSKATKSTQTHKSTQHPDFLTFNHYLSLTHLVGEINSRTTIHPPHPLPQPQLFTLSKAKILDTSSPINLFFKLKSSQYIRFRNRTQNHSCRFNLGTTSSSSAFWRGFLKRGGGLIASVVGELRFAVEVVV